MTTHIHPSTTTTSDELFAFCVRHANPELWRTTVPLIVRRQCNGHKGLIATWIAIHWLMVLWSAEGRTDFGVRDIAREACVGRNELTGPNGYIQRLVQLDLLQIVGYRRIPGLREPRPVYAIDLRDLEARSAQLVPDVLHEAGVRPPPKPAPPNQLPLFPDMPDALADVPGLPADVSARPESEPAPALWPANGTVLDTTHVDCPEFGTALHEIGTGLPAEVPGMHRNGTDAHATGTDVPESVPANARNRDVEREKERKKERERETLTHADLPHLIQTITTTVIAELTSVVPEQPTTPPPPAPPANAPPLPAPPLALWAADREQISQRDQFQLELLAGQYDGSTGGFGAYWLGRAILMADACLEPKGQRATITYLKAMLKRWHETGQWGSDLEQAPAPTATLAKADDLPPTAVPVAQPAVTTYTRLTGHTLRSRQATDIANTVTDLDAWERIIREWQDHGWNEKNIAGLIDRYRAQTGQGPAECVSDISIVLAPIDGEVKGRWLARFRATTNTTDKRAILEQFAAAYPDVSLGEADA